MQDDFMNPEPGIEPVPGYCLTQKLGRGGFGQVWKAYAPGGFQVALKFVPLEQDCGEIELQALDIIRDIRHPNLLTTFASWQLQHWLVIGMELADKTLLDRFHEAAGEGHAGIPRDELIDYFQEASRGIDFLNEPRQLPGGTQRFAIQHRDIKPQNILLVGNGIKVADFGLAKVMERTVAGHSGGLTTAYAAPEFFNGLTNRMSDQYSLAVTYCKVRGGALPFEGSASEMMAGHLTRPPVLTMLPEAERAVVARALSKDPKDRWPSCRAFVEALRTCDNVPKVAPSAAAGAAPNAAPKETRDITTPHGRPVTSNVGGTPVPQARTLGSTDAFDVKWFQDKAPPAPPAEIVRTVRPPVEQLPESSRRPPIAAESSQAAPLRMWLVGRETDCDVIVAQDAVSGHHCRLTETATGFVIEDLGSSNGTYVNGHRIAARVRVSAADRITLGQRIPLPWPTNSPTPREAKVISIGRDADNDIVLDHAKVSGHHARIVMVGAGEARIEDLGSTNGIAIGRPELKVKQAKLNPGDVVYFGSLAIPALDLLRGKVKQASNRRSVVLQGAPLVLGRNADCDVVFDLPGVTGRHARLFRSGAHALIEDLGSTNGTFINGVRIQQPREVKAGDTIGLGSLTFELEVA